MKISDIEDADRLVTKEYFDNKLSAGLAQLELRITDKMIASERGQRLWIWGLYGLLIVSQGGVYALLINWLSKHPQP